MKLKYPVYVPYLTGNEKKYVNECLDSSWISSRGSFIESFEKAFASYTGAAHASAVSNGTVALHLALLALGIGKGDEVIVPTLTYVASVNAIRYVDATPVFIDSFSGDWQMNYEELEKKITSRTKAVIAVHLYGHPCEMNKITAICKKHGLYLIEDCAESIGSSFESKMTGTFGHIAAFSFYGNKTITTGEGGMVMSNDAALIDKVNRLKMQGVDPMKRYWHDIIGYNYRMTNICAAIGLAQLEKIGEIVPKKIKIAGWYREQFEKNGIKCQETASNVVNTSWMFSILCPDASLREELMNRLLHESGIETRPVFYPAHTLPMYYNPADTDYPSAIDIGSRGINLPSYPALSEEDVIAIATEVSACIHSMKSTIA